MSTRNEPENNFVPASPDVPTPPAPASMPAPLTAQPAVGQPTSIMAILGLVFAFFIPLLGLIFSIVGISQTKQNKQGGRGLAIAGLIISSIFMLLGLLWFVIFLVAALNSDTSNNNSGNSSFSDSLSSPSSSEKKIEGVIGEEVRVGDYSLTAISVVRPYTVENSFMQPDDGKEYIEVKVKIVNNSSSSQSYSDYDFKLRNSTGVEAFTSFVEDTSDRLSSASLAPGGNVTGTIVFEVEKSETNLILIYRPGYFSDSTAEITL